MELDELDLDLTGLQVPPSRGRKPTEVQHAYVRDLTAEDIALLIANPHRDVTTPAIQRLKTSHHQLARLLAEGRTQAECHLITGYSISRISLLTMDPAFAELVEYYSEMVREVYVNVHQRLASFGLDVLEELQGRLEDDPSKFSSKELESMMGTAFDRAGFGPKSTQVHEMRDITVSDLLEAVKKEVQERQSGRITTLDASARTSKDSGADEGDGPIIEAELHPASAEVIRLPRPGEDV